jgi:hypothetical protein
LLLAASMTKAVVIATILLSALVAHAETVAEKKARNAIDDAMTQDAADIKDCGKKVTVKFDWKAYDALDWKKIGRDKVDMLGYELGSVKEIGTGINQLCADKDYKAALAKISTIIYRSTNNDQIRVKATVAGGTMTLENYSFGSTRAADDYVTAGKAAL